MSSVPIPTPFEIKRKYRLSPQALHFLAQARLTAKHILSGRDMRRVIIVGPCSIHDKLSALEYAKRFQQLAKEVEETCFLVMRVYCEKSRTSTGWKGLLYDPHLDGSQDMGTGLLWTREIFITLTEWQVPIAVEFVDPLAACYFADLVTWGFVGARTCASQPHRQFASSLDIPIGFKNSTDGNLDDAVHGILVSGIPHSFLSIDEKLALMRSTGNPHAHLVLRGANDATNYDAHSVGKAVERLKQARLSPRILIDCSHGNCQKQWHRQKEAFFSVLQQIEEGSSALVGLMLESHLESGFQPLCEDPSFLKHSVSITDPCIDWDTTEELILAAHRSFSLTTLRR
ncbi:MAG TPA: 3-deoxy-7-phosphoheptulonate synthase [Rhabdochlamydiaceae bacterium]|jgi:3-deoxy-7-phosphoheptulonate synthase